MVKPSDPTYIHGKPGVWHDYKVFFCAFAAIAVVTIFFFSRPEPKANCPAGMTYIPRIEACLSGAAIPTF